MCTIMCLCVYVQVRLQSFHEILACNPVRLCACLYVLLYLHNYVLMCVCARVAAGLPKEPGDPGGL
jgi:hypothetical protein